MSDKQMFALLSFLLAAILAAVASFVPPVQGRLLALAVGFTALGLAVQVSG